MNYFASIYCSSELDAAKLKARITERLESAGSIAVEDVHIEEVSQEESTHPLG